MLAIWQILAGTVNVQGAKKNVLLAKRLYSKLLCGSEAICYLAGALSYAHC